MVGFEPSYLLIEQAKEVTTEFKVGSLNPLNLYPIIIKQSIVDWIVKDCGRDPIQVQRRSVISYGVQLVGSIGRWRQRGLKIEKDARRDIQ